MIRIPQIILSLVICCLLTLTQAQTYHLTVSNEPFVFLENAQSAFEGPWDVPEFQLPIGFDFELFDLTSVQLNSYFNSLGGVYEVNLDEDHLYMLIPFYASLIDRGYQQDSALSPISYQTVGPAGQRIFTLEFREAGLFEGLESDYSIFLEYISFQLRLYEDSGDIEFQYGPYFIQTGPEILFDPFPGPIVGLLKDADWNSLGGYIGEIILLEGNPLKPTLVTDTTPVFLDWPIPENTVYRFSRIGTSVTDHLSTVPQPMFFPNPTSGVIHLNESNAKDVIYPIIVLDVLGKPVCQWSTEAEISAVGLAAGSYYAIVHTQGKVVTEKLLVLPE